jgi:proteasome lid subunit RPN8/RPN11
MDPREYHSTRFALPTITYMRRWQEDPVSAYHLIPPGRTIPPLPDRRVTPEELPGVWHTVDEMCARAGL